MPYTGISPIIWAEILLLASMTAVIGQTCHAAQSQSTQNTCAADWGAEREGGGKEIQFTYVKGLFMQESPSAELKQPGQHPSFGAKISWPEILDMVQPNRKLLLLIRHGEAQHNVIQAYVGEKEWAEVTQHCSWTNRSSGEELQLFDPPLTANGVFQAGLLRDALENGDTTFKDLTGDHPSTVVVSPLTRTLETYRTVLGQFYAPDNVRVDEYCRERYGHNTCDARSPVDPKSVTQDTARLADADSLVKCRTSAGLKDRFPELQFPITEGNLGLGLVSNSDTWWRSDVRESDKDLNARAQKFLERVYADVEEGVIFVVTHSGFLDAVLQGVGRKPYSATNAELVPVLVQTCD